MYILASLSVSPWLNFCPSRMLFWLHFCPNIEKKRSLAWHCFQIFGHIVSLRFLRVILWSLLNDLCTVSDSKVETNGTYLVLSSVLYYAAWMLSTMYSLLNSESVRAKRSFRIRVPFIFCSNIIPMCYISLENTTVLHAIESLEFFSYVADIEFNRATKLGVLWTQHQWQQRTIVLDL